MTGLTYDRIQQRSIHNAYLSSIALLDQLIYYRVRNVEIDLRADPPLDPYAGASDVDDWHVYHVVGQQGRGKLSDYLRVLRAFHDAVPEHEVVTLTLELKGDDLGSAAPAFDAHGRHRTPDGLDARLRAQLGEHNIFTPAALMRRCPQARTLQEAVATCGWPTVDELRGKFIITVHEYNWRGEPRPYPAPHPYVTWRTKSMWEYVDGGAKALQRAAFIAPLFLWKSDAELRAVPFAVFHTELKEDPGAGLHGLERAMAIRRDPAFARMILRSADNDAGPATFAASQRAGLNFLLTDHVDWHATPWARTHNRHLYPFAPVGVVGAAVWTEAHAASELRERQHLIELAVRSGDIDGTADSFGFAGEHVTTPRPTEWSAFVSVASDTAEVHRHAKGALMARASAEPSAPFFAVARHGDDEQLQVHYRLHAGGGTAFQAAHFPYDGQGLHGEDAIFLRLRLRPTPSGGVIAEGLGSIDLHRWHRIGAPVEFPTWLGLQGLAACSNDPASTTRDGHSPRFLFGNVMKDDVRRAAASLPIVRRIGHVVDFQVVDHTYPPPR